MTLSVQQGQDIRNYVDKDNGLIAREIFSDPDIYQLELEQIFLRCWLFMCHESQIPSPGDFFANFIADSPVVVVRDKDMGVQVLVNSCRHRGNSVCRAEEGHATSFMCTYHGWTYDLKGDLVGIPGFKEHYHEDLDRASWGLIKAAQVDIYQGFVFATMDPQAPSLHDFLDEAGRQALDGFAKQGDMRAWGGVSKYVIPSNWKLAHDNNWDFYHTIITHASPRMARAEYGGPQGPTGVPRDTNPVRPIFLSQYGHCATDTAPRSLFPNMFFNGTEIEMRVPKGPRTTELWRWSFYGADWDAEKQRTGKRRQVHHLGAAGFFGLDDGENWGECTKGSAPIIQRRYPYNYAMNLGNGEIIQDEGQPPRIDARITEHSQLWIYRSWAEYMAANSWDEYRANAPKAAGRV